MTTYLHLSIACSALIVSAWATQSIAADQTTGADSSRVQQVPTATTTPGTVNPVPSTYRSEGTAADRTVPGATRTRATEPGTANPLPATNRTEGTAADRTPPGDTAVRGTGAAQATDEATLRVARSDAPDEDAREVSNAVDREWITLSGEVASVAADSFKLDYGEDDIVVEMDDHDWFDENAVKEGESVTVTGRMDNDFFESRKIEASTVYVDSRNEHYFASAADEEEGLFVSLVRDHLEDDEWVSLTGEVTRVEGQDITLDTGVYEYDIDANGLSYNPFDGEGAERIEVGERVAVYGVMDDADLFDDREIEASSIVTLSSAS